MPPYSGGQRPQGQMGQTSQRLLGTQEALGAAKMGQQTARIQGRSNERIQKAGLASQERIQGEQAGLVRRGQDMTARTGDLDREAQALNQDNDRALKAESQRLLLSAGNARDEAFYKYNTLRDSDSLEERKAYREAIEKSNKEVIDLKQAMLLNELGTYAFGPLADHLRGNLGIPAQGGSSAPGGVPGAPLAPEQRQQQADQMKIQFDKQMIDQSTNMWGVVKNMVQSADLAGDEAARFLTEELRQNPDGGYAKFGFSSSKTGNWNMLIKGKTGNLVSQFMADPEIFEFGKSGASALDVTRAIHCLEALADDVDGQGRTLNRETVAKAQSLPDRERSWYSSLFASGNNPEYDKQAPAVHRDKRAVERLGWVGERAREAAALLKNRAIAADQYISFENQIEANRIVAELMDKHGGNPTLVGRDITTLGFQNMMPKGFNVPAGVVLQKVEEGKLNMPEVDNQTIPQPPQVGPSLRTPAWSANEE